MSLCPVCGREISSKEDEVLLEMLKYLPMSPEEIVKLFHEYYCEVV